MKYWEIIANRLSKAGGSLGWVSAIDSNGRTIWIVDAHSYGKRFVVRVDEKLTGFVEQEGRFARYGFSRLDNPTRFFQTRRRWSLGWVSAIDSEGRTIWILDAHGYGKRFIVHADEIPTAFVELQRAIHEFAVSLIS